MNKSYKKRIIKLKNNKMGILDNDLANIIGIKTKALNKAFKRTFNGINKRDYVYIPSKPESEKIIIQRKQLLGRGGRGYSPKIYTFLGVCFIISRLRLGLSADSKRGLLKIFQYIFNRKDIVLFDYGANRAEEAFKIRFEKIARSVLDVRRHYKVTCSGNTYYIDFYLPEYNLVIEVDEKHHKWQTKNDRIRENAVKKTLGCEFIRVLPKDNFDILMNEILKAILHCPRVKSLQF